MEKTNQSIRKQINKLNKMVNSLTLLSKLEKYKKHKNSDSFNLSKLLEETILEKYKVNLDIEEGIEYYGVDGLIRQLICIVLENAAKYGLTTIDISLHKNNKKVELTFKNDVTEIDLDDIQDWDFLIDNNKDYETLKQEVLKIVEKIH